MLARLVVGDGPLLEKAAPAATRPRRARDLRHQRPAYRPKILIRPAMTLAVCAHPEATINDLLKRRKKFRDPMAFAGSAECEWPCGAAMAFWQADWCKDPYFPPLPPPMTPGEAESALAVLVGLQFLLLRPEVLVRQWAFEHLELIG